jgi:hypothetical protein
MHDAGRIRLATPDDASVIARIYRPIVESTTISFEAEASSETEMRQRIVETLAMYPGLVFEQDAQVVAYAYGSRHRPRIEGESFQLAAPVPPRSNETPNPDGCAPPQPNFQVSADKRLTIGRTSKGVPALFFACTVGVFHWSYYQET